MTAPVAPGAGSRLTSAPVVPVPPTCLATLAACFDALAAALDAAAAFSDAARARWADLRLIRPVAPVAAGVAALVGVEVGVGVGVGVSVREKLLKKADTGAMLGFPLAHPTRPISDNESRQTSGQKAGRLKRSRGAGDRRFGKCI